MNIDNLGKILGPCLTWSSNDDKAVRDYADSVKVISFMIAKYECFEVHKTTAKMLLKPFRDQSKRKVKSIRPSSMMPTNNYVPVTVANAAKKRNKSVDYTGGSLGVTNEFTLPEVYVGSPLAKIFDSMSTEFN